MGRHRGETLRGDRRGETAPHAEGLKNHKDDFHTCTEKYIIKNRNSLKFVYKNHFQL